LLICRGGRGGGGKEEGRRMGGIILVAKKEKKGTSQLNLDCSQNWELLLENKGWQICCKR
jgi:hypothetical protein